MNILIVDDIGTNRKLLRVTLESEGHATLEASDGIEALQILAREIVHAVISDVLMPNMDGFRLCHEIRQNERLRALPFIIYTSTYTSRDDVKLGETLGADKYLMKPAPAEAVLRALKEVMERKQKNTELNDTLDKLQRAHARILDLNADLERRVKERTAELETSNSELSRALSTVKVLNTLLPICSYCRKIRDDKDYWQGVEGYISEHTDAQFSHSICPQCYEQHVKPDFEKYITDIEDLEQGKAAS
jgi:CheY-like chemotaxis protein